jgi:cytidyltransferase-like protein
MKGLAFGVFDSLHEGHRRFLAQALSRCDELVVVVAHPDAVLSLKKRAPVQSLEERLQALAALDARLRAVPGDATLSSWSALKSENPDIVFLGYDQHALKDALESMQVPCETLDAYEPHKYKSSIINA